MAKKRSYQTKRPKQSKRRSAEIDENYYMGLNQVRDHPMFSPLWYWAHVIRHKDNLCPKNGWAVVTSNGVIHVNPAQYAEPKEWAYILAHCLLHLGLGHFQETEDPLAWNVACDHVVAVFLQSFKLGSPPEPMDVRLDENIRNEEKLYQQLMQQGIPDHQHIYSTAGQFETDMIFEEPRPHSWYGGKPPEWEKLFARGLSFAVSGAVEVASGVIDSLAVYHSYNDDNNPSYRARNWFMSSFPLLGALAANFKIIEDQRLCHRLSISVAAVDAQAGEIYMNPAAGLNQEEMRFVMAHELLHVALRHHARCQGRDPYLWNVACDYVINHWLVEMNVGIMPRIGVLYDDELKGLNAEAIYDIIVNDLRKYRKLATLRGVGACDMLDGTTPNWWVMGDGQKLDDFYRRALSQGLNYHQQEGRGFIPAGLIEEILALAHDPIPWDVELARWFDTHFPPLEKVRSYARPSRRQSATPDIPRPRYILRPLDEHDRTFGVILDTSGSMDRRLLGKALGAIASYSVARDVPAVRVVFCDAHPYDQGYMSPELIAGRVKVKGRGGTILMPGIRLLERADDFPKDAPILIITDTECDRIIVQGGRDHAYLIPDGKHLPFPTRADVFKVDRA